MSKTIEELTGAYQDGFRAKFDEMISANGAYNEDECCRAGITAVVRALRDEFVGDWESEELYDEFNKILDGTNGKD